jgi:hypothetical protein
MPHPNPSVYNPIVHVLLLILLSLLGQSSATGFRTTRPIEFHLAEEAKGAQLVAVQESQSPRVWYLHREVQLDDRDIADARVTKDEFGLPAVNARLTAHGPPPRLWRNC